MSKKRKKEEHGIPICLLTLKNESTPSNRIVDIPLPHQRPPEISHSQILPPLSVLCKNLLKLGWDEAALGIVRACITAMPRTMHVLQEEAEIRVWQPAGTCWVREVDVDDEHGEGREEESQTQAIESGECVAGPENAVTVTVEEVAVLL